MSARLVSGNIFFDASDGHRVVQKFNAARTGTRNQHLHLLEPQRQSSFFEDRAELLNHLGGQQLLPQVIAALHDDRVQFPGGVGAKGRGPLDDRPAALPGLAPDLEPDLRGLPSLPPGWAFLLAPGRSLPLLHVRRHHEVHRRSAQPLFRCEHGQVPQQRLLGQTQKAARFFWARQLAVRRSQLLNDAIGENCRGVGIASRLLQVRRFVD
mmetsp:Transcript_177510/g.563147  ORF Transcript_177510/g.563147 Transcript_177510/m.563147 type:complete len:210 (+) Transcript_177510:631-1260(+)